MAAETVELRSLSDIDKIPAAWRFYPTDSICDMIAKISVGGFMLVLTYDDHGPIPEIEIRIEKSSK